MSTELGQVRSMSEGQTETNRKQWTLVHWGVWVLSQKAAACWCQLIFFFFKES